MVEQDQERQGWMRQFVSSPWPWLIYLPFFGVHWLYRPPATVYLFWAGAGLLAFLALYAWGWRRERARLPAAVTILLLSFALAFTGGNWTVIAIYAAALAADLRPSRHGARVVIGFSLAATLFALVVGQLWPWGFIGIFMMVMVGLGNVTRAAMEDKNAALSAAHEEVKLLAATAERERIGRDLHDLLGRSLTLVALKAELAARLAPRDPSGAQAEMRAVADTAREALAEVRAAVAGMTGAGLAREVDLSCSALAAAGIACEVEGEPDRIDGHAGAVLAMALREAVTNVIRHSSATRCLISIRAAGGETSLSVIDDGQGLAVREGGGISGMRARLSAAGGRLHVEGGAQGTRLIASLPLAA